MTVLENVSYGLVVGGARRFAVVLPAAAVYYLTVASADNWAGAVCNLGRYIMPVIPLVLAYATLALADAREGVWTMALALAGWTAILARLLWQDPHAANDCALLLARSVFADGNVYVPNLFLRTWADAAPGLWARVLAWMVVGGVAAWWVRKAAAREAASAARSLIGGAAIVLCLAAVLERWPSVRTRPAWDDAVALADGASAHFLGAVTVRDDAAQPRPGTFQVLVRSRDPREAVAFTVEGEGTIRVGGSAPIVVSGRALPLRVPLTPLRRLTGRRGVEESLGRQDLTLDGALVLRALTP
jgi:hypothetical protein